MSGFLFGLILTVHILVGIAVIVFVLLQHGKGADVGASFGGGSSGSLFGATGSANFLSRTTAILATVFFLTSLGLTYLAGGQQSPSERSVMDAAADQSGPAASAPKALSPADVGVSAPVAPGSKSNEIPK